MVACGRCAYVAVVTVAVVREGAGWAVCFAPRLLRIRMSLQHTAQPVPSLTTWASLFYSIGPFASCVFELAARLRVQR